MWKKIDRFVEEHRMISQNDRILVGLSGGADSILLARYLLGRRETLGLGLVAVHVNHLLRGEEARRDEEFVRDFCRKWNLPCRVYHEDVRAYAKVHRCSEEEAGRILRYRCFDDCAGEENCEKVALAHHGDDLAETMIFRMIRGTGPEGLPGILPVRENRIRPLLCLDRQEICRMLESLGQDYVEDSTNGMADYTRNDIRQNILPEMKRINDRTVLHMARLAEQLQEQNLYVAEQMDRMYEKYVTSGPEEDRVPLAFLNDRGRFEQRELIRRMLFHVSGRRKDITSLHVELILSLLGMQPGKRLDLPYGMRAELDMQELRITRTDPDTSHAMAGCHEYEISREILESGKEIPIRVAGEEYIFRLIATNSVENPKNDCVKYFNYDKIKDNLFFRTRRPGDYFVMDRDGRKKKLRRYFIDQKIPAAGREGRYLLAEGSHILWVTGGRVSEAYKVSGQEKRVLRAEYRKNGGKEKNERENQCFDSGGSCQ